MKSKLFYLVMAGIVLAGCLVFAGCPMEAEEGGLPSTKGKFTLTGADTAEGKYAFIIANLTSDGTEKILGITDSNKDGSLLKGAQIKNAAVNIPLYMYNSSSQQVTSYSRDDTVNSITIVVSNKKELKQPEEFETVDKSVTFSNVTFSDGKAAKDVAEAYTNNLK
ncbi:MAG: hypothetical protein LBD47_10435 [Treponema sp.]|jgi:hypothetical protein|nr:hypothetical protein [Treponema sp.]